MKCKWCKWRNGMWQCTHPDKPHLSSEFCTPENMNDLEAAYDYCADFELEDEEVEE